MAFASNGSFIPSTMTTADPIVITVNRNVDVGDVAVLFFFNSANNVTISSITDSEGNDWNDTGYVNSEGNISIATAMIHNALTNGVSTISINCSSATRTIVRGSTYEGITADWSSEGNKYAEGSNYSLSWTADEEGVAFVAFGFPFDYVFADDDIPGWTQVFVTDDLTGLHSQQVFRKEVEAGTVTCGNTSPSIPYLAQGIVLPYTRAGAGQAVIVL